MSIYWYQPMTANVATLPREATWEADAAALSAIRRAVFIEEQQVPEHLELDDLDTEAGTRHFLIEHQGQAVACARLLASGQIGRMAVLAPYRGTGLGRYLLAFVLQHALASNATTPFLHAQVSALEFYRKLGFVAQGPEFDDAGIPHKHMDLALSREVLSLIYQDAVLRITEPAGFILHSRQMISHGSRSLDIFSTSLDRQLWADESVVESISSLARRSSHSRIRILVSDSKPLQGTSHALLRLSQRLTTAIELRVIKSDATPPKYAFATTDRSQLILFNDETTYTGFANYQAAAESQNLLDEFDRLWDYSSERDPNLGEIFI